MKTLTTFLGFFLLLNSLIIPVSAQSPTQHAKDIVIKKYPNEKILSLKTVDLNNDKKNESIILTDSGNLFFLNSKDVLVLINTGVAYEEEDLEIKVLPASSKEKHVAIVVDTPPSTVVYVYRLENGTLVQKLHFIADIGVDFEKNGEIRQVWKKYRQNGGWDIVSGTFTWDTKTNKYKGSGKYILK
ncbi:hypothetical protein MKX34_11915 [Paenibacillus sp. FSL R5-0636]|uniref:Copper amine oxidase-like N-terminal domain-containing protein n=1 Tax=Paenibacillus odorifer TaxID=189426 RepID=A0AB36J4V7_9BACL|nr:hypothetical protein [Paenibacillus odorifer]OMC99912.1 hypothetical protein BJP49_28775 [Paenibacillus odorifer]OME07067.1 hypothetical protein BSK60_31860 [Paenibacillus odorifer]OME09730.1 hypothetical protein BSK47_31860 [Paenibacillus odorifer]